MNVNLTELADKVNAWCESRGIAPANGQVAEALTVRSLRYYRTVGLLDAPLIGGGSGYTEHHFLQAAAVRVLQSQGLPLNRIHSLLFGRPDEDLRTVLERNDLAPRTSVAPEGPAFARPANWQMQPLTDEFLLISTHGKTLSPTTVQRLREVLSEAQES